MVTGRGLASGKRCCSSSSMTEGPQAPRGLGTHKLGMVQTTLFFASAEKNCTAPASREVGKQRFGLGFQEEGGPTPYHTLVEQGIQRLRHDDDLAAREHTHTGGYHVDVDLFAASWPARSVATGRSISPVLILRRGAGLIIAVFFYALQLSHEFFPQTGLGPRRVVFLYMGLILI